MTRPSSLNKGCVKAPASFTASLIALIPVFISLGKLVTVREMDKQRFANVQRRPRRAAGVLAHNLLSCSHAPGREAFMDPPVADAVRLSGSAARTDSHRAHVPAPPCQPPHSRSASLRTLDDPRPKRNRPPGGPLRGSDVQPPGLVRCQRQRQPE